MSINDAKNQIKLFTVDGPIPVTGGGSPGTEYAEGSARNLFYLPISGVLLFNGLSTEIKTRGNIDFLDNKRAVIIDKFQRRAAEKNLEISFFSRSTRLAQPRLYFSCEGSFSVCFSFLVSELDEQK